MAFSASGRFSSEYHTASSFDPQNEALHSTIAFNENTEGSADMSIELGRGVKRAPREEELSEDGIFTFGSDQQYEMTGTPPLRSRNASGRKTDGALRRDATVRKASEAAKANESVRRSASLGGKKQASLADALKRNNEHTIDDTMQATTTIPSRNTRFTRFTNPSTNNGARVLSGSTLEGSNPENRDPSRFKATQRDATFQGTEESFVIPEMDGATALFAATPSMPRSAKRGSRFTPSASYRMPSRGTEPAHAPLDGVPIPEDARQVYESLQKAVAKIEELEAQRAESNRAADEYEVQITELRTQLEIEQRMRRPDSGLGSEEEGAKEKWRRERAQLQTRVKSLQGRLTQSERQTSIQEAAVDRVTSERDDFAVQFEDTAAVNDQLRENLASLQQENEDLQNELAFLKGESGGSKVRTSKAKRSDRTQEFSTKAMENLTLELQGKKQKKSSSRQRHSTTGVPETMAEVQSGDLTFSQLDEEARDSIARLIQRELQRIQGTAKEHSQALPQRQTSKRRSETTRPRSSLDAQVRRNNEHTMLSSRSNRRAASAPVESDASEAESEGEAELTSRTRGTLRDMTLPSGRQQVQEDDTADLTNLSKASFSASDLRKALEEQRRSNRAKRHSSAPLETGHGYDLPQKAATSGARRKSSLKDITAGLELDATGRLTIRGDNDTQRVPKMVRVQSPHTSDGTINITQKENNGEDLDASVLSNTSHRRRRTAGATDEEHEGETSAFIIPDITIHTSAPGTKTFTTPNHATNACTVCAEANGKHVDIPMPIPVSTRELGEDATLRPVWEPHVSLAHVLKQLQDEVVHLKLQLAKKEAEYNAHDPAVGRRRRQSVLDEMQKLTAEVERRSEMVYRLYDVVEGQKNNLKAADENKTSASVAQNEPAEQEVEETLQSIGMDPAEVAGRVGRSAPDVPEGLQEEYSGDESDELPWEGLSDTE